MPGPFLCAKPIHSYLPAPSLDSGEVSPGSPQQLLSRMPELEVSSVIAERHPIAASLTYFLFGVHSMGMDKYDMLGNGPVRRH